MKKVPIKPIQFVGGASGRINLAARMLNICSAVTAANGGFLDESQILNIKMLFQAESAISNLY